MDPISAIEESGGTPAAAAPTGPGALSSAAAGESLVGADLRDHDLTGADLTGRDLSNADLSGARLIGAKLDGAVLHGANLSGAQLTGAWLTGADLSQVIAERAGLGGVDLTDAAMVGADLTGATISGADATRADLRGAVLDDARLREAVLTGADLTRASAQRADFSEAQLGDASLVDTDMTGAKLRRIAGYESANWIGVHITDVDFSGAYTARRLINDQNYLHEFRNRDRKHRVLYEVWRITSGCGQSVVRWGTLTAAVTILFAIAYTQVDIDYGDHETPLSPLYFSVVTLTTLGFGDVLPASMAAQILVMAEVTVGYCMLSGLLSIFATRMGRRAD